MSVDERVNLTNLLCDVDVARFVVCNFCLNIKFEPKFVHIAWFCGKIWNCGWKHWTFMQLQARKFYVDNSCHLVLLKPPPNVETPKRDHWWANLLYAGSSKRLCLLNQRVLILAVLALSQRGTFSALGGRKTGYGQNGDRLKRRQVKTVTNQNGYRFKVNV